MTLKELRGLSDREIDAAIATWLELPVVWRTLAPYFRPGEPIPDGHQPYLKGVVGNREYDWAVVPYYCRDLRCLHLVEEEITRRRLQQEYIVSLMAVVGLPVVPTTNRELYTLVHTTARQRCEAILLMPMVSTSPPANEVATHD